MGNDLVGYNPQNTTVKNYTDYLKVELKTVPDLFKRETRVQEVKEEPYLDDFDDHDDYDDDYRDDDYKDDDYQEERQPVVIDVKPKKKKKAKKKKESSSLSIKEVKKKEPK